MAAILRPSQWTLRYLNLDRIITHLECEGNQATLFDTDFINKQDFLQLLKSHESISIKGIKGITPKEFSEKLLQLISEGDVDDRGTYWNPFTRQRLFVGDSETKEQTNAILNLTGPAAEVWNVKGEKIGHVKWDQETNNYGFIPDQEATNRATAAEAAAIAAQTAVRAAVATAASGDETGGTKRNADESNDGNCKRRR